MTSPCVLCKTYDGFNSEMPKQIALHSTPYGSVCNVCIKKMVAQWKDLHKLLYDIMHEMHNDMGIPGDRFANYWTRYTFMTGIREGDEYIE